MKQYFLEVAIAVDQLVNTLAGGWADESISSRSWRERRKHPWRRVLIDALFYPIARKHCYKSYLAEKRRLQEPPALRGKR